MASRSQHSGGDGHSKGRSLKSTVRGVMRKASRAEASGEMNVGRGMARMSRSKHGGDNKSRLALGKASAKTLIDATIKKNKAKG